MLKVQQTPIIEAKMSNDPYIKKINHILKSLFHLTPKQISVFLKLRQCSYAETCILNMVDLMESERSIIQKYLAKLMKKGLVYRRPVTLAEFQARCRDNNREDISPSTTKGYLYLYSPISDQDLIAKVKDIGQTWVNEIQSYCSENPLN